LVTNSAALVALTKSTPLFDNRPNRSGPPPRPGEHLPDTAPGQIRVLFQPGQPETLGDDAGMSTNQV
jgi:hypothetical protein